MSGTRSLYGIMLVLGCGYSKDCPPKFAAALFSILSEGLFNSFGRGYVECSATTLLSLELMCTARELVMPVLKSQYQKQLGAGFLRRVIVGIGSWTGVFLCALKSFISLFAVIVQTTFSCLTDYQWLHSAGQIALLFSADV